VSSILRIATIQPQNLGEAVIQAELLKAWNELYQTRSGRLSAVQGHVPSVVWWIVFFGAAITTGFTYLFGLPKLRDAFGDDRHSRGHARAGRGADSRA